MSIDELMPRAREAWADGARSKNALRKNLRVAWDRADEVFSRLSAEEQQDRVRKHRDRRSALTRLRGRKKSGRPLPVRRGVLPEAPISPAVIAVAPVAAALPAVRAEEVPTSLDVPRPAKVRTVPRWPLLLLALPAFVAIWSGWVGLGGLTGFGVVHPLPGIADGVSLNTAITLPIGLETYAAYALYAWLSGAVPPRARTFAMWSAIGSLVLGAGGQVTFHLLVSSGPWVITTIVACLPVVVVGMGAALYHLITNTTEKENRDGEPEHGSLATRGGVPGGDGEDLARERAR